MPKKDTAPAEAVAPTLPPLPARELPPVPGGGSWRPNAAGDGWVENLPADSAADSTTSTNKPE